MKRDVLLRCVIIVSLASLAPWAAALGNAPITLAAAREALTWGVFFSSLTSGLAALRGFLDQSISRAAESTPDQGKT